MNSLTGILIAFILIIFIKNVYWKRLNFLNKQKYNNYMILHSI